MLTTEDLLDLGVREGEGELEAMRRYSDFVTFHAALLKSPLSIYVKGKCTHVASFVLSGVVPVCEYG